MRYEKGLTPGSDPFSVPSRFGERGPHRLRAVPLEHAGIDGRAGGNQQTRHAGVVGTRIPAIPGTVTAPAERRPTIRRVPRIDDRTPGWMRENRRYAVDRTFPGRAMERVAGGAPFDRRVESEFEHDLNCRHVGRPGFIRQRPSFDRSKLLDDPRVVANDGAGLVL